MKKKELKNLARKIADAELIIQTSNDEVAIKNAENEIIKLSGSVSSVLDMMALDEMVQKFLTLKMKQWLLQKKIKIFLDFLKIFWYNIFIKLRNEP